MANFIMGILSLTIGTVLLSGVLIRTVKDTNTTGWSASEIAVWGMITLASIAGLIYGVMNVFGLS